MRSNPLPSLLCFLSLSFAVGLASDRANASATPRQSSAQPQTQSNDAQSNKAAVNPPQTNASGDSIIQVENWTKPKPGWLYVLDPKPDAGGPGGRVWLVDARHAHLAKDRHHQNQDAVLERSDWKNGTMLYATAPQKQSILVIDTAEMRQINVLKIGGAPTLALVAP
jgi:hypothetical protein